MKKAESNDDTWGIRGRIGENQTRPLATFARRIPGIRTLFAVVFALMGLLVGCDEDTVT